jgi:CcmD family protein
MSALATAFAIAWAAVAMYVGWIGHNQRQLAARLRNLAASADDRNEQRATRSKAA